MSVELQRNSNVHGDDAHPPGGGGGGINNDLKDFDDDGRPKRSGTMITASAHIITAVIGSGVLSLAWAIAQLGWVAGPVSLAIFSVITFSTSTMLADCYRSPDPVYGTRNYTYMDVVRANLGGNKVLLCGIAQYGNLVGITIGYTITASISIVAVKRSNCFHAKGVRDHERCNPTNYPYMAIFAVIQIFLSQIPDIHEISWLSIVAALMSFAYSAVGFGLSLAKVIGGVSKNTSLTGERVGIDISLINKIWRSFQALGNIAFAYAYATVLIEIQDTLKSHPAENKVMKKASGIGVTVTTFFYVLCGCLGYAAFGNEAPGNSLTGFGFYEPFWLIDFANICIAIHLIGAYQVFAQPLFGFVESKCRKQWPRSKFINTEHEAKIPFYGNYKVNLFRVIWRTIYVILTSVTAMIFPFFNDILGLIGAASFYPLTVYFPIEMHIKRTKIPKYSLKWILLKLLTWVCLLVSLIAAAGSIQGLVQNLKTFKPFQTMTEE